MGKQSEFVIETRQLTKKYGDFVAVDKLNLRVRRGEVFGVLGPNGAGKTTTILMLLGLTDPTEGDVRVLGLDPTRRPLSVKSRVGYLPDQVGFYDELTARENLIYTAKLNGLPRQEAYRRIDEALEQVGLAHVADQRVGTFSRGMRQRLGVAEILIKQPQLVIMDEPTQGLDPEASREFLDFIRQLKQQKITILLSSHLLYQVQAVCDRVGLFYRGRMALEGTVQDLAKKVLGSGYRVFVEARGDRDAIQKALMALEGASEVRSVGNNRYEIAATQDLRPEAAKAVIQAGGKLFSLAVEEPNLEEIYARYFKEVEHGEAA
nr:ABC transporter ATP-binding protein [Ardenticatena sp.]